MLFRSDFRPDYVFPTNDFLSGDNYYKKKLNHAFSFHLSYAFQYDSSHPNNRLYGSPYQGIAISGYTYNDPHEIGNPMAFYLFQGARLARFSPRLTLNYEWNFGLSWGWKPYNAITNPYNGGVGTRRNAYLNLGLYLSYTLSPHFDLIAGVGVSHFSNGNTRFPNAGINNGGGRIGIAFYPNRTSTTDEATSQEPLPAFHRHVSYDLLLFGAWRRKGVPFEGRIIADRSEERRVGKEC